MTRQETPFIGHCHYCEQGLLRFWQCGQCQQFVAMCDECELVWRDVERLSTGSHIKADSTYPVCPYCQAPSRHWIRPTESQIEAAQLSKLISGRSR